MEQGSRTDRPNQWQDGEQAQHSGLLLASGACTSVAAVLVCGYAMWNGLAILGGLGLQLLLAALGVWAAMHAVQVRRRFSEASDAEASPADTAAPRRPYRWATTKAMSPNRRN